MIGNSFSMFTFFTYAWVFVVLAVACCFEAPGWLLCPSFERALGERFCYLSWRFLFIFFIFWLALMSILSIRGCAVRDSQFWLESSFVYSVVAIGRKDELLSRPLLRDYRGIAFVGLTRLTVFLPAVPKHRVGDSRFLLLSAP